MRCPYCRHGDSRVVDSREVEDGSSIRRRRSCAECSRRFTTVEVATLAVVKRSGATEPFNRDKVLSGVRKACQGRPVAEDDLALLAQRVEDAVRAAGSAEVPAHEVGLAILTPLRELDEVAYLRFASVYRSFESLADFEAEILALRRGAPPPAVAEALDSGPPAPRSPVADPPPSSRRPRGSSARTTAPSPPSQQPRRAVRSPRPG